MVRSNRRFGFVDKCHAPLDTSPFRSMSMRPVAFARATATLGATTPFPSFAITLEIVQGPRLRRILESVQGTGSGGSGSG